MTSLIDCIHSHVHSSMLSIVLVNNNIFVVASTLLCAQDWDVLKPLKMGSGEMEAHKSDRVEWPNEGGRKVRAVWPVSC